MNGLYQAIQEIISNSIDEYYMGFGNKIVIILNNNEISIEDWGRGIPFGMKDNINIMESIFSTAHTGGKFNDKTYQSVAGLNGIGAKATCLSADYFMAISVRDKKQAIIKFENGNLVEYKEIDNNIDKQSGTLILFKPAQAVFKDEPINIKFEYLCNLCKNLSFLTKGLEFTLIDKNNNIEKKYCAKDGILDLLKERTIKPVDKPIYINKKIDNIDIELAFQWTLSEGEEWCFTNGIENIEGGTSITGFKTGLTRNINKLLETDFSGEIVRSGLVYIVSCKVPNPSFANQVKSKVNNPELRSCVDQVVTEILQQLSKKSLDNIKIFLEQEEKATNAAKKAREIVKKNITKKMSIKNALPGKLSTCSSKNVKECELYLIEGDSAASTVKNARNPIYQAVLPLRGKVLNVQKVDIDKALENQEIQDMITAIGTGILDDFDITSLNYDKIILCSDADVDGEHIKVLLLTFFLKYMPKLIEEGHIYAAIPPLYTINYKNNIYYAVDDEELELFKTTHNGEFSVQYLKGLGEMNTESFSDTVMNKDKRKLKQITINNIHDTLKWFEELMGKDVTGRKDFLENNAQYAQIDI